MNDPIILQSPLPGPTVIILGGVHGNETCGVDAIKLLVNLQLKRGRLILMYGNPKAIHQSIRFTEQNLNRMFVDERLLSGEVQSSYEFQRSREILPYLNKAEYLLDIHASLTPHSRPFIICERNGAMLAQYLPQDICCYGFINIEPGGSDGYMNLHGKVGVCVECGYINDALTKEIAYQSALNFLSALDMYEYPLDMNISQLRLEAYELFYTKTDDFKLSRSFFDFDELQPGEVIGYDGGEPVFAKQSTHILFARNRHRVGDEAFILVRKCLP